MRNRPARFAAVAAGLLATAVLSAGIPAHASSRTAPATRTTTHHVRSGLNRVRAPLAPAHDRGDCGTADFYDDSGGHYHLILNSSRGDMVAGDVTIYSDGFASSSASYLISTGTRFDVNGQIFAGFGATGMGASGWVVTSQGWYCVFSPWAPF